MPESNIELKLEQLDQLIKNIGIVFGKALATDNNPYDFTLAKRFTLESEYYTLSHAKSLFDQVDKENRLEQELHLQSIQQVLNEIIQIDPENQTVKEILNNTIQFSNPQYAVKDVYEPMGIYIRVVANPKKVDLKINGENINKTAREVLNEVIPKMVLMREYEIQLSNIKDKLDDLRQKHSKNPTKYSSVYSKTDESFILAQRGRTSIENSTDLKNTVTELNQKIEAFYTANHVVFEEHRGNAIVNALINLLRGLSGILVGLLTSPYLFVNYAETMENTTSYFKPKPTDSAKIFGLFKDNVDYKMLQELPEMQAIETIKSSINILII